jgi:hypothetical protein
MDKDILETADQVYVWQGTACPVSDKEAAVAIASKRKYTVSIDNEIEILLEILSQYCCDPTQPQLINLI